MTEGVVFCRRVRTHGLTPLPKRNMSGKRWGQCHHHCTWRRTNYWSMAVPLSAVSTFVGGGKMTATSWCWTISVRIRCIQSDIFYAGSGCPRFIPPYCQLREGAWLILPVEKELCRRSWSQHYSEGDFGIAHDCIWYSCRFGWWPLGMSVAKIWINPFMNPWERWCV